MPSIFYLFHRYGNLIALIAGGLLPLAFAPFNYYQLAFVCPIILLLTWQYCSTKQAFWRGFLFGLGQFGIGISWVYISIHEYGNADVALAAVFAGLMITALAFLAPALQGYVLTRFFPRNINNQHTIKFCLAFPSSWVLFEWLRSWIFTGFPWLLLGISQTASPLRGLAPIVGEYGLSFVVV